MPNTYGPKGQLLWDSWFFKKNGAVHAFYLQSKPSKNPDEKHEKRITIGHAFSKDLVRWTELPVALEPGDGNAWDNLALWTGSVVEKDDLYYLFYAGRNKDSDRQWIQKIGVATSGDLIHWEKYKGNPVLEARKIYTMDNGRNALGKIGAWRDPFVFPESLFGTYWMTISARIRSKQREYNACVALAESKDLFHWKLGAPVYGPGVYDEIECTQVIRHKGLWYLFFSTQASNYEPNFASKIGGAFGGLHCVLSDSFFGLYRPVNGNGVVLANEKEMYDVRLIEDKGDDFFAVGWLKTPEGKYSGKFSLPFRVRIEGDRVNQI